MELPSEKKPNPKQLRIIKYLESHFWLYLEKLHRLRHFSINLGNDLSQNIQTSLEKLNVLTTFLNRLETMTLSINYLKCKRTSKINLGDILRYVTSLEVIEVSNKTLEDILEKCFELKNLFSLKIIKTTQIPSDNGYPLNLSSFQALKDLPNLQILDISMDLSLSQTMLSFLENFSVPQSITSVKLIFHRMAWNALHSDIVLTDWKMNNVFSQLDICRGFYQKWEDITKLNALTLNFIETEFNLSPSLHFVLLLLKKLRYLNKLNYSNWCDDESGRVALDFAHFLGEMGEIRETISELCIESNIISLGKSGMKTQISEQIEL